MSEEYKKSFNNGVESSKVTSFKQGIIRGILLAIITIISFYNSFTILLKIIIFIVLFFILGTIGSSKKFRGKV